VADRLPVEGNRARLVFSLDPWLLIAVMGLMAVGILFIFSSGVNSTGALVSSEYIKQLIWALVALVLLVAISYVNYNFLRDMSVWIYLFFLILLTLTLLFGRVVNGAKAWIGIFGLGGQPSEFAKIATILFLSRFLANKRTEIRDVQVFLRALLIVAAPMLLIIRQPDTGTTLVFIPIFLAMLFMAGARPHHVLFVAFIGALSVMVSLVPSVETIIYHETNGFGTLLTDIRAFLILAGILALMAASAIFGLRQFKQRVYYWVAYFSLILLISLLLGNVLRMILKDYQVMRFIIFLDPSLDPKGSGWNLIQSMTAIGSGGFLGKGFLLGTQSHYRFLPMQSTDFIFSILGEEWGFLGGLLVFGLFLLLLFRLLNFILAIKDNFGVLVIAGFVGMFVTHVFVNIGMTIGIMPVTGIPLYFLSYGGSSLLAGSLAIGIAMNIYSRRFRF
jgi:rod shape determining protein RodA